jgi:hypothetical protein
VFSSKDTFKLSGNWVDFNEIDFDSKSTELLILKLILWGIENYGSIF